jgi:hypothetical protein
MSHYRKAAHNQVLNLMIVQSAHDRFNAVLFHVAGSMGIIQMPEDVFHMGRDEIARQAIYVPKTGCS